MRTVLIVISLAITSPLAAEESRRFIAVDSIATGADETADARACLEGLCWSPKDFEVTCQPEPAADAAHQAVLRFDSPVSTGNSDNDRVAVLWYQPPDSHPDNLKAAIVVVHESGSSMPVGKLFARLFAGQGVHAFLVQLPNYGLRRTAKQKPTGDQFLVAMRQGIADVRRARDAVAVLPGVDPDRISLQGTSLGGFVASTAAGIDRSFANVFVMVAGGDLYSMLQSGQREAAELRKRLEEAGFSGNRLRDLLWVVEPTRLAHRLDPKTTWLYSAEFDQVVPIENALAFKTAARLPHDHHIRLPGDHVTTIVYVPLILDHVIKQVRGNPSP